MGSSSASPPCVGNGPSLHPSCQCPGTGKGDDIPTTQEVCRCQREVSWQEQKAGRNTAEASQPESIWPLDPSLPGRASGWPLAGAKLVAGLWPGGGLAGWLGAGPPTVLPAGSHGSRHLPPPAANRHPGCAGLCRDLKGVPGSWPWEPEGALSKGPVVTFQVSK